MKKRKALIGLGGVICLLALILACTSIFRNGSHNEEAPIKPVENQLIPFVQAWNSAAENINPRFRLLGSDALSSEIIVANIKKWCEPFTQALPADFDKQLAKFSSKSPVTTFHAWANFCKEHHRNEPLPINQEMDPRELATALNSYLGIKVNGRVPDYVTPETVSIIVSRNRFCDYFELEKEKLHAAGIDANINFCQRLATLGEFPVLDDLVNE